MFLLQQFFVNFFLYLLGWQPGIQEGTADWDENWDKFEDDGMSNCFWTFRVSLFFVKYILSIFLVRIFQRWASSIHIHLL